MTTDSLIETKKFSSLPMVVTLVKTIFVFEKRFISVRIRLRIRIRIQIRIRKYF